MAERTPLVLLAGLLCDEDVWQDVAAKLQDVAQATIFAFPGYSTIESMAAAVLDRAPPRFAIAGHSMGGRVAIEVARRAPDRLLGIALLNTGTHLTGPQEPETRGRLVQLAKAEGMRALADAWLPGMLGRAYEPSEPLLTRLVCMVERNSVESYTAQIEALLNRPAASHVLPRIRVPALLVSAASDSWSPPQQHEAMQALIPGSDLVIVPDAGHMCLVEQPAHVANALRSWLDRVGASRAADLSRGRRGSS